MLGSTQPKVLAEFYEKVFDKVPDFSNGEWYGWQVGSSFLMMGQHDDMESQAKEPGRLMFNLETKEVQEEFGRIVRLGAKVIKEPYEIEGGWIATLADPDGNYFQLMTPWEES